MPSNLSKYYFYCHLTHFRQHIYLIYEVQFVKAARFFNTKQSNHRYKAYNLCLVFKTSDIFDKLHSFVYSHCNYTNVLFLITYFHFQKSANSPKMVHLSVNMCLENCSHQSVHHQFINFKRYHRNNKHRILTEILVIIVELLQHMFKQRINTLQNLTQHIFSCFFHSKRKTQQQRKAFIAKWQNIFLFIKSERRNRFLTTNQIVLNKSLFWRYKRLNHDKFNQMFLLIQTKWKQTNKKQQSSRLHCIKKVTIEWNFSHPKCDGITNKQNDNNYIIFILSRRLSYCVKHH